MHGGLLGGIVAILVLALPAVALGAPTWLAPQKLSEEGHVAGEAQVAANGQGEDLAVWQRDRKQIEVSARAAGTAPWSPPVPITGGTETVEAPQVGLDAHGDAVVAWLSFNGTDWTIEAAQRTGPAGPFSKPVELADLGSTKIMDTRPDLAMNGKGEAVAVWMRSGSAGKGIVEAAVKPPGATWRTPDEKITEEGTELHPPEVGIDAAGNVTAVWEQVVATETRVVVSSRTATGKWPAVPVPISSTGGAASNEPRLAVNSAGDAVALWEHFICPEEKIEAATRTGPAGAWSKPATLSPGNAGACGEPGPHQVAIDAVGDTAAVWQRIVETDKEVIEATVGRTSTGAWQPAAGISNPGTKLIEQEPSLDLDEAGDAVVVTESVKAGSEKLIEAIPGNAVIGGWGKPRIISAAGEEAREPQVALDSQGNAAAVWVRQDGKGAYLAEAAGYDSSGPKLGSLSIPSAGAIGQTLAFSVSPFDTWSLLGPTTWSFGDGGSATGTSVAHAYGAGGSFTVTVTGSDVLGNRSSASGVVVVPSTPSPSAPFKPTALAPRITRAALTHARFRVSAEPTAVSARRRRAPRGTTFRFTLNEPASLRIALQRTVRGLRSGRRCVAPSARLRRHHARHCSRSVTVGTLTRAKEPTGAGMLPFSGRIGTRPLAPGAYRAVLTATAAGLRSVPVSLGLTIVR